jgi:hypothetical protein
MLNKIDEEMIIKFIQRNYPVSRIKTNNRFKRGIVFDDGAYLFSDGTMNIKTRLVGILKKVFDCQTNEAIEIIDKTLNF